LTGANLWIETLSNIFVTGKFRSMLAILFGIGLYLQYKKRSAIPGNWPGGYLKRTFYLALIGLVHGYLIWWGDILLTYSIAALVSCLFAGLSDRILKVGALCAGALAVAMGALMVAMTFVIEATGETMALPGVLGELLSREHELSVFQSGSVLDQLATRAAYFTLVAMGEMTFLLWLLPLFTAGILLGRSGAFSRAGANPRVLRLCVGVGFLVGLPLSLLALLGILQGVTMPYAMAAELISGPILAFGYVGAIALWVHSGRIQALQRAIANVGRAALSNYLLQSLLCTFIFYSWGLGWFGRLDRAQMLGVVAIVWIVNLALSYLWLRSFAMGPVEWVWRRLTESRRLGIRRRAVSAYSPTRVSNFEL
jgi:uncharacterized protein